MKLGKFQISGINLFPLFFAVKYRGTNNIIVGRATDREADQTTDDEVESSQIRVRRVVQTGSHRKRLTEQKQFRASDVEQ